MKNLKITKGKWIAESSEIIRPASSSSISPFWKQICSFVNSGTDECKANAQLIADAGTTTNKCGKLPSELLAERDELLDALKDLVWLIEHSALNEELLESINRKAKPSLYKALEL